MNYQDGKDIVAKLEAGLVTGVAARFETRQTSDITNLIETKMVSPKAFSPRGKNGFEAQDLSERDPVTPEGRKLFT